MEAPPPDQRSPIEIAAEAAFRNHANSVVQIIAYTRKKGRSAAKKEFIGSGFIIDKEAEVTETCLVITCEHVLKHKFDSLLVRLTDTNDDLQATVLRFDEYFDLGVLSVQGNFNRLHPAIELTNGTADGIAVGTLVALVSYYNPRGLRPQLNSNEPVFPTRPGAYGGHIQGRPMYKGKKGIKLPHSCYGIQGCSGGLLICHQTQQAIGVMQQSVNQVHLAISTETVCTFLEAWLEESTIDVEDDDTISQILVKCRALY